MPDLLYPDEIDQRLNWPLGRAQRLARQRRLPYVLLPDGSFRFDWSEIQALVVRVPSIGRREAATGLSTMRSEGRCNT